MKRIFAMVLALMLAMGAFGAFAEDAITIGISGPLTGPYAMYGLGVVHGAEIAVCHQGAEIFECRIGFRLLFAAARRACQQNCRRGQYR